MNLTNLPGELHLGGEGINTRLRLCLGLRQRIRACLQEKLTSWSGHNSIFTYSLVARGTLSKSLIVKAWIISTRAPTVASMCARPGRHTGASIGLAGFTLCNVQKASINWVTKWDFSFRSRSDRLAIDGAGLSSFSSSKSVTSKTTNMKKKLMSNSSYGCIRRFSVQR